MATAGRRSVGRASMPPAPSHRPPTFSLVGDGHRTSAPAGSRPKVPVYDTTDCDEIQRIHAGSRPTGVAAGRAPGPPSVGLPALQRAGPLEAIPY